MQRPARRAACTAAAHRPPAAPQSVTAKCHVTKYRGQRAAVDAYVLLHRGAYTCAREICEGEPTDKCAAGGRRCCLAGLPRGLQARLAAAARGPAASPRRPPAGAPTTACAASSCYWVRASFR